MPVLVGLDQIHISQITEADGVESYDTPVKVAGAMELGVSANIDSQNLFADDGVSEIIDNFSSAEVSITLKDVSNELLGQMLGKEKDSNGVWIDSADDIAPFIALGFRAKKSNNDYRYVWMYKGRIKLPEEAYKTKGESVDYQTVALTGTFIKRPKDGQWRRSVDSDDEEVGTGTIDSWFDAVYETPEEDTTTT
ncbi:major tail protein [Halobacillus sp. A5]|uniref:major tail protein n=1 Tax=Halobacillus sp. A5 TaxID=2880263 RepID=UPI0020A6844E|nr:major tail protein [Halobacillus sp. A5]MCP3025996.1 hypothetical protein [Halobacillus sp. A5]